MDVRHLDLLRELADRGSVAAVAAATHRTPSAVSQQLRTAQRELGTELVRPHGRGIRLTDAGRLLAAEAVQVQVALADVQARWDAFRGAPAGTVSVAALPSAATFLLPAVEAALAGGGVDLRLADVDLAEDAFGALTADHDVVVAHSLTSVRPAGRTGSSSCRWPTSRSTSRCPPRTRWRGTARCRRGRSPGARGSACPAATPSTRC